MSDGKCFQLSFPRENNTKQYGKSTCKELSIQSWKNESHNKIQMAAIEEGEVERPSYSIAELMFSSL